MSRTTLFLAAAAVLTLIALIVGLPTGATPRPTVSPSTAWTKPLVAPPPAKPGSLKLEGRLSHPYIMPGSSELFVTASLTGVEVPGAERAAVNLALVLDRSGSMQGRKLTQAKQAAKHLVAQLRAVDRLAIVHYGSDVRSLPSAYATEANKERMSRFISSIYDEGGTNIGEGLERARELLLANGSELKASRLILISDGQPTEGQTRPGALVSLAREIRQMGISVSAIGVGEDFNEDLMQGLAEVGAGAYAYLNDPSQLATIFQKDLQQASTLVARNVSLELELPENVELVDVLGYQSTRVGRTVRVPLPDFSAGQLERVVGRLSVRAPSAGTGFNVTNMRVVYEDLLSGDPATSDVRLASVVTDRLEEMHSRRDKEATVIATRAQSAQNLTRAAEAMAKKDAPSAKRAFEQNRMLFDDAAQVAGAAALAPEAAAVQQLSSDFENAPDEKAVADTVKRAKVNARKGYGRMGSTY